MKINSTYILKALTIYDQIPRLLSTNELRVIN